MTSKQRAAQPVAGADRAFGARWQWRFCICCGACSEAGFAWPGAAAQLPVVRQSTWSP